MKYKEAVLIGGPWDGQRPQVLEGVREVLVPHYDRSTINCLRPSTPSEPVVYTPHRYRLNPLLSNDRCSAYVHSEISDEVVLQVLVAGYHVERTPTKIGMSVGYSVVQSPSGP